MLPAPIHFPNHWELQKLVLNSLIVSNLTPYPNYEHGPCSLRHPFFHQYFPNQ